MDDVRPVAGIAEIDALAEVLGERLETYNRDALGAGSGCAPWAFELREGAGIIGGITGKDLFGWTQVARLWVAPDRRGRRVGATLMNRVEIRARRRGHTGIEVSTMSFQAPAFYRRCGFIEAGRIPGKPGGHSRIFFWAPRKIALILARRYARRDDAALGI